MLRRVLVIAALCLLPAVANAQSQSRGPFELTLGGSAGNSSRFNGFSGNIDGSIGYFFSDVLEVSGRQTLTYSDLSGKQLNGSTRVALDLHFPLGDQGQFVPFVGANVGYLYGDSIKDTIEAAPEVGLKWFVNNTTFLYAMVEYQIILDRHRSTQSSFNDGVFAYGLGVGFRF